MKLRNKGDYRDVIGEVAAQELVPSCGVLARVRIDDPCTGIATFSQALPGRASTQKMKTASAGATPIERKQIAVGLASGVQYRPVGVAAGVGARANGIKR